MLFMLQLTHTVWQLKNNSIVKVAIFSNHGAREIKLFLSDGGENGGHTGVGFVELSKPMQHRTYFDEECYHLSEFSVASPMLH